MKASMLPRKANNYLILNINNFKKVDNPRRLGGGGRSMWIKFFFVEFRHVIPALLLYCNTTELYYCIIFHIDGNNLLLPQERKLIENRKHFEITLG